MLVLGWTDNFLTNTCQQIFVVDKYVLMILTKIFWRNTCWQIYFDKYLLTGANKFARSRPWRPRCPVRPTLLLEESKSEKLGRGPHRWLGVLNQIPPNGTWQSWSHCLTRTLKRQSWSCLPVFLSAPPGRPTIGSNMGQQISLWWNQPSSSSRILTLGSISENFNQFTCCQQYIMKPGYMKYWYEGKQYPQKSKVNGSPQNKK